MRVPLGGEGHLGRFDRGVRLTSPRPDTLPLLLLERDAFARTSLSKITFDIAGSSGTPKVAEFETYAA